MRTKTSKRSCVAAMALGVAGLGLAGCSSLPKNPLGRGLADKTAQGEGTPTATDIRPATPSPASEPAPRLQPTDLFGADAQTTDALLGQQPVAVIREGSGEIRRYAGIDCMLLVILYPDNRGTRTVQAVEGSAARTSTLQTDTQTCLNGF
ncbi:MAG: hypothetical protein AAFR29_01845 [Pseudomonadota bacterium]